MGRTYEIFEKAGVTVERYGEPSRPLLRVANERGQVMFGWRESAEGERHSPFDDVAVRTPRGLEYHGNLCDPGRLLRMAGEPARLVEALRVALWRAFG